MTTVVAAFFGSLSGVVIGGGLMWLVYLQPRQKQVERVRPAPRPSPSQGAPEPGFVPSDKPVTVGKVGFGRVKKATRL
jgi:hypothetical protein